MMEFLSALLKLSAFIALFFLFSRFLQLFTRIRFIRTQTRKKKSEKKRKTAQESNKKKILQIKTI